MKTTKRILLTLVSMIGMTCAWAQDAVTVNPTTNADKWTFTMPDGDVELEVEYYTELKEDETIDYSAIGSTADIWLSRTLKTGYWNTFASPVAIDADQLTDLGITAVKQLSTSSFSEGVLTLDFTDATTIEAGKPYLVKVSADKEIGAFDGATVSGTTTAKETSAVDFIPTLGKTLVTGPVGNESNANAVLFLATGNKLKTPTVVNAPEQESSYMKGFRAYFQLKGDAINAARSFRLNLGDESTGISQIENGELRMENSVYDLQGRKVNAQPNSQFSTLNSQLKKGVYIVNGKKVIVK